MTHRPSRHETCMETAEVFSQRSTCSRSQVGAVIAIDGRVLSTGYNGAPAGMPHCSHPCNCSVMIERGRDEDVEVHAVNCPSLKPCDITIHAEANAIAFAARHGVAVEGAEMYVTLSPCLMCAKLLINAGISRVWMKEMYRDPAGVEMLGNAGIITALLR